MAASYTMREMAWKMKRTYFIPKDEKNIQVHMKLKNIKPSTQHPLFVLHILLQLKIRVTIPGTHVDMYTHVNKNPSA